MPSSRHIYFNPSRLISSFFFFNDTATTEIYPLSLHDALPISRPGPRLRPDRLRVDGADDREPVLGLAVVGTVHPDRKSTRLNSSHVRISYAVFCLKKKKQANVANAQRAAPNELPQQAPAGPML